MNAAGLLRRRGAYLATSVTVLAALAIGGSACGIPIETTPSALAANQVPPALFVASTTTIPSRPGPAPRGVQVTIYLVNTLQQLVTATRTIKPPTRSQPATTGMQAVLDALADGPNGKEASLGYSTDLPGGVGLKALDLQPNGVADVQVNGVFLAQGGEVAIGEYAQVVWTLATSVPRIKSVLFFSAGAASGALLANGQFVERPVKPNDYTSLLASS